MKTLYYLFLVNRISKYTARNGVTHGSILLDALYAALLDNLFGAKK